jgi:hypothetical protein
VGLEEEYPASVELETNLVENSQFLVLHVHNHCLNKIAIGGIIFLDPLVEIAVVSFSVYFVSWHNCLPRQTAQYEMERASYCS